MSVIELRPFSLLAPLLSPRRRGMSQIGCRLVRDPADAKGRPGEVLRGRHHPQKEASAEAGLGKKADGVHGEGQRTTRSLHGGAGPQQ